MKITFLGTGGAFCFADENYQSNIFIEDNDDNLLVDCGTTFREAFKAIGHKVEDVKKIFITHNHADHTGDMEYVGFKTYFTLGFPFGEHKPELYGHYQTLEDLWFSNLSGGMRSLQGETATLETYFDTVYLDGNDSFEIGDTTIDIIQTVHVVDDRKIVPSHGLMMNANDKKIFFTGDCQMAPNQMRTFYNQADVIFHDAELAEYPNSVHAQYHELKKLPDAIKSKMYLYHYTKSENMPDAVADGFLGFVDRGDSFEY
jgi:ribonuclease BN (tRNA processing enzyme)